MAALFVVGVTASLTDGRTFGASLGYTFANLVETIGSAWLISRHRGSGPWFSEVREVVALIVSAATVNSLSACIGAGTAALTGRASFGDFWLTWWVADGLGILLVAPLMLTWASRSSPRSPARAIESAVFQVAWFVAAWWTFLGAHDFHRLSVQPYMLMALLAWPALRMGPRGTTLALALLALAALLTHGMGVASADPSLRHHVQDQLLSLQWFLACAAIAGMLMAASYAEMRSERGRLRTLGDNLASGVISQMVQERDGRRRFIHIGARSADILGVRPEEALHNASVVAERILEQDRSMVAEAEAASARTMRPFDVVPRLRMPDGAIRWIRISATPVARERGRILWEAVYTDVTAEKESEQRLRQSEERYRRLVHNSQLPVIVSSIASGRVLFANDCAAALFHLPAAEVTGRVSDDFWIEPGECARYVGLTLDNGGVSGFEARLRNADGEERWVSISTNLIDFDGERAIFAVFSDVTDIKAAQAALEDERTFLTTLIRTLPDPVWLKDLNGAYALVNPAGERFFRMNESELLGRNDYDFHAREEADRFRRRDREVLSAGTTAVSQEWVEECEGGPVLLEVSRTPMRDSSDRLIGVLGVARDITASFRAEQLLRDRVELQEQLERMAATAPGALYSFRLGPDGSASLLYASPAMAEFAQAVSEGVAGDATEAFLFVHPEDRAAFHASIGESARSLTPWRVDFRAMTRDGRERWFNAHAMPVRDPDGGTCWHGIISEITDRKRMEIALAEEAMRRRVLMEQSQDGIVVMDPAGWVREANESFAAMLGYSQDEILGLNIWDWDFDSTREQHRDNLAKLDRARLTMETRHRRKDGVQIDVEVSVSGVEIGGQTLIYAIHRDISARKAAERALRRSEEMYRHLVESGTAGIWTMDVNQRTTYVNRQMASMIGYSPEELIGRRTEDFMDEETRRSAPPMGGVRAAETIRMPFNLLHKDGQKIRVLGACRLFFDDAGRYAGGIAMMTDLTEYQRMEERLFESQKTASIARLAGGVAHDFNNLLTPILGLASILRETASDADREMLDSIVSASRSAAELTRQLLAYSGTGQMAIEPVEIARIVRDMYGLLRASVRRNVELRMDALEAGAVLADPGQIRQIVVNLVVNGGEAIAENEPGSVAIGVRRRELGLDEFRDQLSRECLKPGAYMEVEVADTGCGISEELRRKIFDPFFSTKFTGRGLGLAAVAGITRALDGGLAVETSPGAGSTFLLLLPLFQAPAPSPEPQVDEASPAILVLEDEPMVRTLLAAVLRSCGYGVLPVSNGADALAAFDADPGRVRGLMLDPAISGANGKQTIEALEARMPGLPILVISGYSQEEAFHLAGDHPDMAFAGKPFDVGELKDLIGRLFGLPSAVVTAS